MSKIILWVKSNWMWLLIIPGVIYAILKFAKYLVIAYDLELGLPYFVRKKEKELEDKLDKKEEELKEDIKKVEDNRDEQWKKVTSGEKKPADVFNDFVGRNKNDK